MKHEIINNGKPELENMSKPEFNVFCKSILDIIIEDKKDKEKSPPEEDGDFPFKNNILSETNCLILQHIFVKMSNFYFFVKI